MEEPSPPVQEPTRAPASNVLLPASILLAAIIIAGSIVYLVSSRNQPTQQANAPSATSTAQAPNAKLPDISARDVILGDANAPVSLIEYGDYQCPFCGQVFKEVEPQLRDEYIKTGKVRMVFRNFQFLGPESTNAGAAAECAKDQEKFWLYHDALYIAETKDAKENNGSLNRALFVKLAGSVGLDVPTFTTCLDSNKYVAQIGTEQTDATAIGVNSTPTTYINGQAIEGAQPYAVFKAAIDLALQKK